MGNTQSGSKRKDVDPAFLKPSGLYAASQCALEHRKYFPAPIFFFFPVKG